MANITRWARQYLFKSPSPPLPILSTGFEILDQSQKLEEEIYDWYKPEDRYPVRIGEIFKDKYQVLSKLGYGAYSTVWLCRDLKARSYIALKVGERNSTQCSREVEVYQHLNKLSSSHAGSSLIRNTLDTFRVPSSNGSYQCLVHEPLGMSLSFLQSQCHNSRMPKTLLRSTVIHILFALDFLHTEAKVIHTDLQPKNIMLAIKDKSILVELDNRERHTPSPRKVIGDRVIHTSQQLKIPEDHGRPTLGDFGEARFGQLEYTGDIQPWLYRAPEIILDLPWNEKADIWNLGVMIWDLFEDKHMFNTKNNFGENTNLHHIAEMVALLGDAPADFINRSRFGKRYFDVQGKWLGSIEIPPISLEQSEENLEGKDKKQFLELIRKMLQWRPDARPSAAELLKDPWLNEQ